MFKIVLSYFSAFCDHESGTFELESAYAERLGLVAYDERILKQELRRDL